MTRGIIECDDTMLIQIYGRGSINMDRSELYSNGSMTILYSTLLAPIGKLNACGLPILGYIYFGIAPPVEKKKTNVACYVRFWHCSG